MLSNENSRLVRFLRWSEKYTKTDMVYLAHGGFWLSGSHVVSAGVSFVLALAFANLLPKESYGTYKYILTIFGVLSISCLRGIDTLITQAAARGNDGTVIEGLQIKMRWALLGSAAALCVALYYLFAGNITIAAGLLCAAFFIPLMEPLGIFNALLVGKKSFPLISGISVSSQLAASVGLVIIMLLTANPVIVFLVYCSIWTISRYISLRITLKRFPPNDKYEPGALSYGLHSSIIGGTSTLIGSLDSILIFHYLGATELAVYAFAMAPVSHIRNILETLYTLALPKLARQHGSDIGKILYKRSAVLFLISLCITATYIVLAYPFYHFIFPQYKEAILFSQVFSIAIIFQVTNAFVSATIDSRTTLIPKPLLYLWNIPSIVLALSAIFLIQNYGLWGAIIGQLLSLASSSTVTWFMWWTVKDKTLSTNEQTR